MIQLKKTCLFMLACLLTITLQAQNAHDKYLAGAVPEIDGKVVFNKIVHLPGVSKDAIFKQIHNWMDHYLTPPNSRVVYQDATEGVVVGLGNDTIIFKSTALSLDRTFITYQLEARVSDAECDLQVTKINYKYQDTEKYSAEEMISDRVALNKSKTKIYKGIAKWRVNTIDFIDSIFDDATKSLSELKVATLSIPAATITPAIETKAVSEPFEVKEYKAENVIKNTEEASIYSKLSNPNTVCVLYDESSKAEHIITNQFTGIGNIFGKESVFLTVSMREAFYDALDASKEFTLHFYTKEENKLSEKPFISIKCKRTIAQSIVPESVVDSSLRKELSVQPIYQLFINSIIAVDVLK